MKKKIVIGVTFVAAFSLVAVTMFKSGVLNSKANESTVTQKEVDNNDEDYKKFVEEYRIDGVDISITSLDDLYNEFNKYESVDETLRKNILAKASDEVIAQFLVNEQSELFKLSSEVQADDIYSEVTKEDIKNDTIAKLDVDYFEKGNDSHRKVTKITNKFGSTLEITSTDEKEGNVTRGGFKHVKTLRDEQTWKEYGHRNFSVTYSGALFSITARFQYTLHWGAIESRNIFIEDSSLLPGAISLTPGLSNIDRSKSSYIGDYVGGFVTAKLNFAGAFFGGFNTGTLKITMKVIQGRDQGHPSKPKMQITQKSELYEKPLS